MSGGGGRLKSGLSALLLPLAWLDGVLRPGWRRLWAHARLRAALGAGAVDASVVLEGPVELHGTRRVRLGRALYLYPGQYWETREQGRIEIGDGVVLSRGVHLVAYQRLVIGAGTMIGEYASLRDANHRRDGPDLRHAGHESRPIVVGPRVWIGRGAIVLPGVTIGEGAVIGANAVVNRDVAPGTVVGGVPARPLHGAWARR